MICGNPHIRESGKVFQLFISWFASHFFVFPFFLYLGWREIIFFSNISYEIRDITIESDENQNVRRAEFIIRAHMH
jgi:hypothetical protein